MATGGIRRTEWQFPVDGNLAGVDNPSADKRRPLALGAGDLHLRTLEKRHTTPRDPKNLPPGLRNVPKGKWRTHFSALRAEPTPLWRIYGYHFVSNGLRRTNACSFISNCHRWHTFLAFRRIWVNNPWNREHFLGDSGPQSGAAQQLTDLVDTRGLEDLEVRNLSGSPELSG
jgi:hypothetical protein